MKTDREIGKERLQEAILRFHEEESGVFTEEDDKPISYSPRFEKRMKGLLAQRSAVRRHYPFRRVIAAVIAAMLLGMATLVIAAGEPVTAFVAQIYEKFAEIHMGEDVPKNAPGTIENLYTFDVVPEDYVRADAIIGTTMAHTTWRKFNGDEIVLSQMVLDTHALVDTVDADTEIVWFGEYRVFCAVRDGVAKYIWNTDEYFFYMVCDDRFPPEMIEAMITSLRVKS